MPGPLVIAAASTVMNIAEIDSPTNGNALQSKRRGPTAILALHKDFQRSRTEYGSPANWIERRVRYLNQNELKSVIDYSPQKRWFGYTLQSIAYAVSRRPSVFDA